MSTTATIRVPGLKVTALDPHGAPTRTAVGAREVRLGRTDKMKFVGWVPLETAIRIKPSCIWT